MKVLVFRSSSKSKVVQGWFEESVELSFGRSGNVSSLRNNDKGSQWFLCLFTGPVRRKRSWVWGHLEEKATR